jgi:hypothetical protein
VKKLPAADLKAFKDEYHSFSGCCLDEATRHRVDHSVALYAFEPSEPDGDPGGALTKLDDGTWAAFEESQDYTGHGCQCGSTSSVHSTRAEAIKFGLGRELCDILSIPFPKR